DYRYFPDPDLAPVTVTDEEVERIHTSLGELPADLRTRLENTYGITPYDSDVLVNQGRALVDYYIQLADACGDGKMAGNWMQQDVLRVLNEQQIDISKYPLRPQTLAELLKQVRAGKLDTSRAREVLSDMLASGRSVAESVKNLGIQQVDESALVDLCRELLAANPKIAAEVKAGQQKGIGQLIGQAKKKNPNVNPNRVRKICLDLIEKET
ncbi:MAG: Asp-tRNA(Asn)/Glu-tRNA(Gln) amidotransferase GatCAB subunit B, partial [Thermoguttaceae bacterium]